MWSSSVEAVCPSMERSTAELTYTATNPRPGWLKRLLLNSVDNIAWNQKNTPVFLIVKYLLWTAAEAGLGFYNGHESSDAVGGAADIRGGEQGQKQGQTTDRYTKTPEFAPPIKYLWSTIDKVEVRKVGGYRTNQFS